MKVLVVDDDPVCLRLLEATLRRRGSDVMTARDGAEALALARERRPQVVITDVVMPRMTGYELCGRLKADPDLRGTPVILLTALSDSTDVLSALQCGADGFITKPYDNGFLAGAVDNLIARAGQTQQPHPDGQIELSFNGRNYLLKPDVRQITHLLLSTYENALQKNLQLEQANRTLTVMEQNLREANDLLTEKQSNLDRALEAAAGIQRTLLPRGGPETDALRVAWKFQPCDMIGGDIFNMVRLDATRYGFYILDVSGHGVPSALVTVSVSQALTPDSGALVRRGTGGAPAQIVPPGEVLAQLDREYPIERFDKCFTIAYLVVDIEKGTARYSTAGHPPPLLVRADGEIERLDKGGPVIGIGVGMEYEEEEKSLRSGDRILLCTDGVVEHRSEQGELYGDARFEHAAGKLAALPIQAMLDGVMEDVMSFSRRAPEDDISLLGIEYCR